MTAMHHARGYGYSEPIDLSPMHERYLERVVKEDHLACDMEPEVENTIEDITGIPPAEGSVLAMLRAHLGQLYPTFDDRVAAGVRMGLWPSWERFYDMEPEEQDEYERGQS